MSRIPADRKAISLLALKEPVVLEPQRVVLALKTLFPELRDVRIDVAETPDQASALTMMIGDELLAIMFFAMPIPADTLEPALGNELMWKEARAAFAPSPAHLLVTALAKEESFAQRLRSSWLVSMAVTALASVYPVNGVFWSTSLVVIEPGRFQREAVAASRGNWPTDLWFSLEWFKGESFERDNAIVCRTRGIGYFASREIECGPYAIEPSQLGMLVQGLGRHVILTGTAFGDQDTLELGEGSGRFARISYEQSAYGGGAPVMRVVLS